MKKLLIPFCVLFSVMGEAQTWTRFFPSTNNYSCLVIDSLGNKWIGTDYGISKFDGVTWKTYTTNDGLVHNAIRCITIDRNTGSMWIGTENGASRFDGKTWNNYSSETGLINNYINAITIDKRGQVYFGTNGGVSIYNGQGWTHYTTGNGLVNNNVLSIAIDNNDIAWYGTSDGLSKFDGKTWTNTKFGTVVIGVKTILIDNKGIKWILIDNNLMTIDSPEPLACNLNGYTNSFAIDLEGNKWIGTSYGVSKFDNKSRIDYKTSDGLVSSNVRSVAIDSEGNKWLATSYGISKFDGTKWTNYFNDNGLAPGNNYSIAIDSKGNKWFACYGGGVSKFNDTIWTRYTELNGLASNLVNSIAIDANGVKWFGTDKGVSKFDGTNWTTYTVESGLVDNVVKSIAIDNQGNKWFGSRYGGVSKFDDINWSTYYVSDIQSRDINVNAIAIDKEGNKWFGLTYRGVTKFDDVELFSYKEFENKTVLSIAIDNENNKWCGTSSYDILKFDDKISTTFLTAEEQPYNQIYASAIDAAENKWFGTFYGVSKFDGIKMKNYTYNDGLAGRDIYSIAIDNEGNKWFGSYGQGISKLSDGGPKPQIPPLKIQKGLIFNDQNTNGKKDPNETTISGQIVKIDSNYTTTQNNGLFYTSLNNGTHTFTYRPQANWKLTTDSSITITVTDTPIKDTLYFGVQAIANKHEVETKLTGTATRAGFESKSWINYSNSGTLAENGTVSYTLADEASLVQTIPVADSVIGKRLVWKYSNLIPNEQRQISITTQMPGVNYLGDTLVSIAKIKSDFSTFSDTLKQVLTGSYDPNDKLVAQGIGSKGYVLFGKELEYTVRFQNTGTDTAFNVNIRDTLDLNLDVASLQIVASSHSVKLDLRGQNEATFRFENILLPDSNVNQLGSNGFVKYTIKPKKNLPENTSVKNKAHIYFDFNPAIITNETVNTYVSKLPAIVTGIQGFQSNKSASIFPNPAKDEFTIVFPQSGTYEISLANIQGKSIKNWNESVGQETTLSVEDVEPGLYLYTAQGRNGQRYMGKLVIGK